MTMLADPPSTETKPGTGEQPNPSGADPKDQNPSPPSDPKVDPKSQAAPEEGNEEPQGDDKPPKDVKPTPIEEAATARVMAELGKLADQLGIEGEFKTAEDLQAAITTRQAEQANEVDESEIDDLFVEAYAGIRDSLTGLKLEVDVDGVKHEVSLTADQVRNLVGANMADLRDSLMGKTHEQTFNLLGLAAAQMIPEDMHDAFAKAAQGKDGKGLSVSQWLTEVTEHSAKNTKAWKARERDFAAEKQAEYARGWEDGKGAPAGQPSSRTDVSSSGKLTAEQVQRMSPAERAQAWRERPDEMRAL